MTLKHGGSLIVKQAKSSFLNSNLTRLKQFPGLVQDNYIQKYQDKKKTNKQTCAIGSFTIMDSEIRPTVLD